jgi:glutamine---fructose-6-phosphate transaminase (isomerizing)
MSVPYHMIGYIREIPQALGKTLDENEDQLQSLVALARLRPIHRIVLVGVGSSYTAAMMALPLFRKHSHILTYVFAPAELRPFAEQLVDEHTLLVSISRSGERGGVVDAMKEAVRTGALGLAITGSPDSLLAQNCPRVFLTREGPEVTFAKTKSVATCTGLLMRLALAFAGPDDTDAVIRLRHLRAAPGAFEEALAAVEPAIRDMIGAVHIHKAVMCGGTVSNHGAALEFSIKLQEAANTPVMGNDTDNLLHGPWGPVNSTWLTLLLMTRHDLELSKKALELTGKLSGHRLIISEPGLPSHGLAEYTLTLPRPVDIYASGLMYLAPLQLLTYYWSLANGLNPDAPAGMQHMLDAMVPPGRQEPEMRGLALGPSEQTQ